MEKSRTKTRISTKRRDSTIAFLNFFNCCFPYFTISLNKFSHAPFLLRLQPVVYQAYQWIKRQCHQYSIYELRYDNMTKIIRKIKLAAEHEHQKVNQNPIAKLAGGDKRDRKPHVFLIICPAQQAVDLARDQVKERIKAQ